MCMEFHPSLQNASSSPESHPHRSEGHEGHRAAATGRQGVGCEKQAPSLAPCWSHEPARTHGLLRAASCPPLAFPSLRSGAGV